MRMGERRAKEATSRRSSARGEGSTPPPTGRTHSHQSGSLPDSQASTGMLPGTVEVKLDYMSFWHCRAKLRTDTESIRFPHHFLHPRTELEDVHSPVGSGGHSQTALSSNWLSTVGPMGTKTAIRNGPHSQETQHTKQKMRRCKTIHSKLPGKKINHIIVTADRRCRWQD